MGLPLLAAVVGPGSVMSVSISIAAGRFSSVRYRSSCWRASRQVLAALRLFVVVEWPFFMPFESQSSIGPVAGVVLAITGHPLPRLAVQTFDLLGQATAGIALFVTGLVLSARALSLNTNIVLGVVLKNVAHPLLVVRLAILFGVKAPELREAILLAAIPAGFFGILFGLNYGVEFQDADSTLTISSLVGVLTLGLAIVLTAPMNQVS
jgi:predicted permease